MPVFETLGLDPLFVDYEQAWQIQRGVHADVVSGSKPETVLLLEHASVFTAGKRTEPEERPTDGTPVIDVDRGGKITWHGPGQLVGYPIMKLPDPIDVVGYVRWLVDGAYEKVAAIGIRVAEKVTMHGFALNCNNSLAPYDTIVACGIRDAKTTTLSILAQKDITPTMAAEVIKRHLGEIEKRR